MIEEICAVCNKVECFKTMCNHYICCDCALESISCPVCNCNPVDSEFFPEDINDAIKTKFAEGKEYYLDPEDYRGRYYRVEIKVVWTLDGETQSYGISFPKRELPGHYRLGTAFLSMHIGVMTPTFVYDVLNSPYYEKLKKFEEIGYEFTIEDFTDYLEFVIYSANEHFY